MFGDSRRQSMDEQDSRDFGKFLGEVIVEAMLYCGRLFLQVNW